MEKEIKITPPEGFEIDKEHSTFDCIRFKPIGNKRWRDNEDAKIEGYYIHSCSDITPSYTCNSPSNYNVFATEKQGEQNPAWSDEDEKMLKWLCRIVHSQRVDKVITLKEELELGEWMDKWLNHNPQPHWKPSDEQVEALYNLMKYAVSLSAWGELENKIESLYKDLKKLREE